VNQYGNALGTRSLRRVWPSPAAHDANSSTAAGGTSVRPRIVFAMTGKKTMSATMIKRGMTLSGPNQLRVIGANAMIGTVLAAIAIGSSVSRAACQRAVARPASVPRTSPTTSPPSASPPV